MLDFIYCNRTIGSQLPFTTHTIPNRLSLSIPETIDQTSAFDKREIPEYLWMNYSEQNRVKPNKTLELKVLICSSRRFLLNDDSCCRCMGTRYFLLLLQRNFYLNALWSVARFFQRWEQPSIFNESSVRFKACSTTWMSVLFSYSRSTPRGFHQLLRFSLSLQKNKIIIVIINITIIQFKWTAVFFRNGALGSFLISPYKRTYNTW